jgi:hypothetical protein
MMQYYSVTNSVWTGLSTSTAMPVYYGTYTVVYVPAYLGQSAYAFVSDSTGTTGLNVSNPTDLGTLAVVTLNIPAIVSRTPVCTVTFTYLNNILAQYYTNCQLFAATGGVGTGTVTVTLNAYNIGTTTWEQLKWSQIGDLLNISFNVIISYT